MILRYAVAFNISTHVTNFCSDHKFSVTLADIYTIHIQQHLRSALNVYITFYATTFASTSAFLKTLLQEADDMIR